MTMTDPFPGTFSTSIEDKKHPAAPEPASWGVLMVGFALVIYLYTRLRRHNRCACHHHS